MVFHFRFFARLLKKKTGHYMYGLESDIFKWPIVLSIIHQFILSVMYFLAAAPAGSISKFFFKRQYVHMHIESLKIPHEGSVLPTWRLCIHRWGSLLCSVTLVAVTVFCFEDHLLLLNLLADYQWLLHLFFSSNKFGGVDLIHDM